MYTLNSDGADEAITEGYRVVAYHNAEEGNEIWIYRSVDGVTWVQGVVESGGFEPSRAAVHFSLPDERYRIVGMEEWLKATRYIRIDLFPDEFLNQCCNRIRDSFGDETPKGVVAQTGLLLFLNSQLED